MSEISKDGQEHPRKPAQSKSILKKVSRAFGKKKAPVYEPVLDPAAPRDEKKPMMEAESSELLARNFKKLQETRLSEISIPQADIVALEVNSGYADLMEELSEHGYSRMPVYEDTLDNPLGLIHIKDIFIANGADDSQADFSLRPFIRPLLYVPPSMRLSLLLQKMQTDHIHMALIIDEYGGVDGLLTIEDLLEQIVGDITDEHDEEEAKLWSLESQGIYVASARSPLGAFMEGTEMALALPDNDEEIDTLGGLVYVNTARIPAKGEVIRLDSGHEIEIVDADPRSIKRLRVRTPEAAARATPKGAAKS